MHNSCMGVTGITNTLSHLAAGQGHWRHWPTHPGDQLRHPLQLLQRPAPCCRLTTPCPVHPWLRRRLPVCCHLLQVVPQLLMQGLPHLTAAGGWRTCCLCVERLPTNQKSQVCSYGCLGGKFLVSSWQEMNERPPHSMHLLLSALSSCICRGRMHPRSL
jgi:hypothetical protein